MVFDDLCARQFALARIQNTIIVGYGSGTCRVIFARCIPVQFPKLKVEMTRSFARAVDILLQSLLWILFPLTSLRHIISTPFTDWLSSVHIFWWFFGTFVACVGWKRFFCGGFVMAKNSPREERRRFDPWLITTPELSAVPHSSLSVQ